MRVHVCVCVCACTYVRVTGVNFLLEFFFFSPSEFLFHGHSCIIKIVMCKCLGPIICDRLLIIWTAIKQKLPARKSACLGARRKISELGEGNDRHSPWQVTVFQPSLGIMKTAGHTSPCTVDKQVPWTYPCVPRSEVGETWLLELLRVFAQKPTLFPLVLRVTWVLKSEKRNPHHRKWKPASSGQLWSHRQASACL